MTQELGPAARALLDAAREGLGPDAAAVRRMRGKIEAAAAAGAGAGAGAGTGAGAGALLAKIGVGALVVALVAGAVVYGRRGDDAVAPRIELPTRRAEVAVPPSREVAVPPAEEGEGEGEGEGEIEIEMAPVAAGRSRAVAVAAVVPGAVVPGAAGAVSDSSTSAAAAVSVSGAASAPAPAAAPAPPKRADLAREVELVDQAMAALRRADPSGALAAVRSHRIETAGAGQLAEDAAAIEIEALCRLHDPAAGAKLAAFDARWPESAQRSRLSTRCP